MTIIDYCGFNDHILPNWVHLIGGSNDPEMLRYSIIIIIMGPFIVIDAENIIKGLCGVL